MAIETIIKNWKTVELQEIADVDSGGNAPQGDIYFENGKYPFVRVQHFDGSKVYVDRFNLINELAVKKYRLKKFKNKSIIFPKSGASIRLEKRAILSADSYVVGHLCIVKPKYIDDKFLYFVLKQEKFATSENGSTLPFLNISHIKRKQIMIPEDIKEQKVIAQALTTMQDAIIGQEELIAKLKELKRSMMQYFFTHGTKGEKTKITEIGDIPESWDIVPLAKYLEKTKSYDPSKKPDKEFEYIDVSAVSREFFKILTVQKMIGKDAPSRARKHIQTGDIIFATVRPTLQRIAIVSEEFNNQVCSTGYCVLRTKPDLYRDFLFHYLCTDWVQKYVEGRQSGASYPAIRDGVLFEMIIPFPKLDEQKIIGNSLTAVDSKVTLVQKKLSAYKKLFKTLLHELMSGERRVNI